MSTEPRHSFDVNLGSFPAQFVPRYLACCGSPASNPADCWWSAPVCLHSSSKSYSPPSRRWFAARSSLFGCSIFRYLPCRWYNDSTLAQQKDWGPAASVFIGSTFPARFFIFTKAAVSFRVRLFAAGGVEIICAGVRVACDWMYCCFSRCRRNGVTSTIICEGDELFPCSGDTAEWRGWCLAFCFFRPSDHSETRQLYRYWRIWQCSLVLKTLNIR